MGDLLGWMGWLIKPFGSCNFQWHTLEIRHWPMDGWLVLLGDGAQLRPGALQGLERWLIDIQQVQHVCHRETSLSLPANQPLLLPDLLYSDEDCLDAYGQRCDPWLKPGWVEESFWSSPWLMNLSVWRMRWLRDR